VTFYTQAHKPGTALDKLNISANLTLGRLYIGKTESEEVGLALFPGLTSDVYRHHFEAKGDGLHTVFTLEVNADEWEFLYGYQNLHIVLHGDPDEFERRIGPLARFGSSREPNTSIGVHKLGASYTGADFRLIGEYSYADRTADGDARNSDSLFFRGEYDLRPYFTTVAGFDLFYNDVNDRNGDEWERLTGLPAHMNYGESWNVGFISSFTDNLKLSVEYHNGTGTNWIPRAYNDIGKAPKHWDFWRASLTYVF
jgi:hypothetical protein